MTPGNKVLYVLSSPHSGSTLLGIVLGSHPDIVFGGELFEIPNPAWSDERSCSCGLPGASCPFWSEVRARYIRSGSTNPDSPSENYKWGWRSFPRALLGERMASSEFRRHARDVRALARAIGETSGRSVVIDTSKDPTRALAYLLGPPGEPDVRFLHLIRDGRGVVSSRTGREMRTSPDGTARRTATFRYSILWVFANLIFTLSFSRRKGRYLRVRYEDFIDDPARTLGTIGKFLDVDLTSVVASVKAGALFPPGHVAAGNRMRLSGGVQVQRDRASTASALPPGDRRVFRWVAGWYARLNGYG